MLSCFSRVCLFVTLWRIAHQAPESMGFSRQEYWSVLPCPSPGDIPNPGIEPLHHNRILHCWATGEVQIFVYLWPIISFLFPLLTCPRTVPNMPMKLFPKIYFSQRPVRGGGGGGCLASHIMGWCPLHFYLQGAFLDMCSVSLAPRIENIWPLDLVLKLGLAPFCPCHSC